MPSAIIPCPACSTRLILDDGNAGSTVICPGCQETLKFPDTVSLDARPTVIPKKAAAPQPKAVHRLTRSRASIDEETAPPVEPPPTRQARQLPSRRRQDEDETKRLAAIGGVDREIDFDLGRFEKRGMTHFACPGCHRPNWIRSSDAGSVIVCSGCGQEVVAPTDDAPARLVEPADGKAESRPKTVLPTRRRVEDEQLGERPAPSRSVARHRPAEAVPAAPEPAAGGAEGEDTPPPIQPIQPIPAKGDLVLEPGELPSTRAIARRQAREAEPEPEPEPAEPEPEEPAQVAAALPRGGFRLGGNTRELQLTPRVEEVVDMETSAGWGSTAEFHPRTRKLLISGLVACALIVAAVVTWFLRNRFLEATPDSVSDVPNPMENVEAARPVLDRFFAATSIDELVGLVRHPELTRPRMELFYARNPLRARRVVGEDEQWNELKTGNTEFVTGRITTDNARAYDVALEIVPGGEPKVDWEFVHNWAEVPWRDFLTTPVDDAVDFRVTATSDRNYDYIYKDKELDYFCFKLVDPADDMSTYGYCHKDSPAALSLIESMRRARQSGQLNDQGEPFVRCILRLRFSPEGRKSNQVRIEGFVTDSWIIP